MPEGLAPPLRWLPSPALRHWHHPERVAALLQRVWAAVTAPVQPVRHEGLAALEVVGVRRVHQAANGSVRCWSLEATDAGPTWQAIPDAEFGLHPLPVRDFWLRSHVDLHGVDLREAGLAGTDGDVEASGLPAYLDELQAWLTHRLHRHADLRRLRQRVATSLALDAETLRLARFVHHKAEAADRKLVSAAAWNLAVRHRAAMLQVEREAPALLPLYGALLANRQLIIHDPHEAAQAIRLHLERQGIRPSGWRLALRSPRRLQLMVRRHYRGPLDEAIVAHLQVLQDFGVREAPAAELLAAVWSHHGNVGYRWAEYADEVGAHAAVFGHIARCYAQAEASVPAPGQVALREHMRGVVDWVYGTNLTALAKTQRRAGWAWLVRSAQDWAAAEAARVGSNRHWPVPAPWRVRGFELIPLADEQALREEGRRMHHCAADRGQDCVEGTALLISIRRADSGRRVATVQYDLGTWPRRITAMRGPVNAEPVPAARRAAEQSLAHLSAWQVPASRPPEPVRYLRQADGRLEQIGFKARRNLNLIDDLHYLSLYHGAEFVQASTLPPLQRIVLAAMHESLPGLRAREDDEDQPRGLRNATTALIRAIERRPAQAIRRWWRWVDVAVRDACIDRMYAWRRQTAEESDAVLFDQPFETARSRAAVGLSAACAPMQARGIALRLVTVPVGPNVDDRAIVLEGDLDRANEVAAELRLNVRFEDAANQSTTSD